MYIKLDRVISEMFRFVEIKEGLDFKEITTRQIAFLYTFQEQLLDYVEEIKLS